MKSIDIKSIIIGALLTSTIFLGVAATSKDDAGKWDGKQEWLTTTEIVLRNAGQEEFYKAPGDKEAHYHKVTGWEPMYVHEKWGWIYRKRIK
ncbi:MAG: hypothetical protein QF685_06510 [Verrucomicrobiota bacterium]|nr:hypothetical protein [Verrucomicrobiota bacterium]